MSEFLDSLQRQSAELQLKTQERISALQIRQHELLVEAAELLVRTQRVILDGTVAEAKARGLPTPGKPS